MSWVNRKLVYHCTVQWLYNVHSQITARDTAMNSWDGTLHTVGIPYEVHNKHSQKNLGIPYSLIHCSQYEDYAMNAWEAWPDAYIGRTANRYIFYILPEKGRKLSPQKNFGLFVVFTPPPHPHVACSFIQAVL